MIVVDVGCYDHPAHQGVRQDSIAILVERFSPHTVHGFDPHPRLEEGMTVVGETTIWKWRKAAWVYDGFVQYDPSPDRPLSARVLTTAERTSVPCFDLANWMQDLPFESDKVVLKLDAQGAEYPLLERLIDLDLDEWLTLLLIEWHDDRAEDRERLEKALRCPMEPWEL